MDQATARRMAFVRYLLAKAVEESEKPEPMCSAGLLMMHDAVELFLQIACERHGVGSKRLEFMDYIEHLGPKLAGGVVAGKESMRRLNKARVGLKHSGVHPSRREIEAFRVTTRLFFVDNAPLVFGMALEDITLVALVEPAPVKEMLEAANAELKAGKVADAAASAAKAFDMLVRARKEEYERRTGSRSAKRFGFWAPRALRAAGREAERFGEEIVAAIEELRNQSQLGALGFDEEECARFRRLTPGVALTMGGGYVTHQWRAESEMAAEDIEWCLDFVAQAALATARGTVTDGVRGHGGVPSESLGNKSISENEGTPGST